MQTFFLSSTFADMHFERDAVQEITLARVNEVAKQYGQTVSFCDLRWGIDTLDLDSEEGSRKVLEVCLDEIDRCRPPFIVILGERYGWIPESSLVESVAKSKHLQLEDLRRSVTALEVEYGALRPERRGAQTLFYFREILGPAPAVYGAEDEEHAAMLNELKSRIRELTNGCCRNYQVTWEDGRLRGVEAFAEMLAEDVIRIMRHEWEKQAVLTPFELEREKQWNYVRERGAAFVGRKRILDTCLSAVERGKKQIFIKGDTGSGKSMLFCALALELERQGWDVMPFVGGLTTESNDAMDILRNGVIYLEEKLGVKNRFLDEIDEQTGMQKSHSAGEWRERLGELGSAYAAAGHKFIIMLDAVDQLLADSTRNSLAFIPSRLNENFRFLLTANTSFREIDTDYITVVELDEGERVEVIEGILDRTGRKLDRTVKEAMSQLPSAGNPLYLSFLVQRLCMMNYEDYFSIQARGDGMSAISAHQREIVASCPSSTEALCSYVLAEAGRRINPTLVPRVLQFMSVSRYGLRESDLRTLLGGAWNVLDFAHFISYMSDCFILRDDGRYDFSHKSIREGILSAIDIDSVNAELLAYFKTIEEDASVAEELIYHTYRANDMAYFREFIGRLTERTAIKLAVGVPLDLNHPLIAAARSCSAIITENGAEWLVQTIDSADAIQGSVYFYEFVNVIVLMYTSTMSNIKLCIALQEALYRLATRLGEAGLEDGERVLMLARYQLSNVYRQTLDTEYLKKATKISLEGFEIGKSMYEADPTPERFRTLIDLSRQLSYALGDDEVVGQAYDFLDEVVDLATDRYQDEPCAETAVDFFNCIIALSQMYVMMNSFDAAFAEMQAGVDVVRPYLAELPEDRGYQAVFQAYNALGSQITMCLSNNNTTLQQFYANGLSYRAERKVLNALAADSDTGVIDTNLLYAQLERAVYEDDETEDAAEPSFENLFAQIAGKTESEGTMSEEEGAEIDENDIFGGADFAKLNGMLAGFGNDDDDDEDEEDDAKDTYTSKALRTLWLDAIGLAEEALRASGNETLWKAAIFNAHLSMGTTYLQDGDSDKARSEYFTALHIAETMSEADYNAVSRMLISKGKGVLARTYLEEGDTENAYRYARDAQVESENLYATTDMMSVRENLFIAYVVLIQLVSADSDLFEEGEAVELFRKAFPFIEAYPSMVVDQYYMVPILYLSAASYLAEAGEAKEDAIAYCKRAKEFCLELDPELNDALLMGFAQSADVLLDRLKGDPFAFDFSKFKFD